MRDFRKLAHLAEQLGDKLFAALISSDNTGKVKAFCEKLVGDFSTSATMTVGGRNYEILSILEGDEKHISGETMVNRAREMNASLGREDCNYILDHQSEIPTALRGKVYFVFPDLRPASAEFIACVHWVGDSWFQRWLWLGDDLPGDSCRVLRRFEIPSGF